MVEPGKLRKTLGRFATGVTIMTTRDSVGNPVGMTANSFNSLSLDPPLVLWSIAKSSSNFEVFNEADHFAVHVLHEDQEQLSNQFATKDIDRFENVDHEQGDDGLPVLKDYHARFQCEVASRYDGGDHIIMVGHVKNVEESEGKPLMFYQGRYARL